MRILAWLLVSVIVASLAPQTQDITGTWVGKREGPGGEQELVWELKVVDGRISGTQRLLWEKLPSLTAESPAPHSSSRSRTSSSVTSRGRSSKEKLPATSCASHSRHSLDAAAEGRGARTLEARRRLQAQERRLQVVALQEAAEGAASRAARLSHAAARRRRPTAPHPSTTRRCRK
jgi:hypothetical protein